MSDDISTRERRVLFLRPRRSSAALVATSAIATALGAAVLSPAAAAPSTWTEPDNPSVAAALLLIGGSVLAVIAVITLLVYLPSMMGRGGSGDLVYADPEWFGGPRSGVKSDQESLPTQTGGSGATW